MIEVNSPIDGSDKTVGCDWLAKETMVEQLLLAFCILCLIPQISSLLFYQDQVVNPNLIHVLLRKGRFRASALDLGQATQRELLSLPLKALGLFSPKQAGEYLCPGRVPYDEHLMLPPTISYLSPEKLAALEPALREASSKKIQLYAIKRDYVNGNTKGSWDMIREGIERALCYMKRLVRRLYEMVVGTTHEGVQVVYQKIISPGSKSIQLRRVALVPFVSRLPSLAPVAGLALRRVSLAPRRQNMYWFGGRNYSKLFHMFLANMTETPLGDDGGSAADEWFDDIDDLYNYCPVHRHPHGMARKVSDLEAPSDPITGKCKCHYHGY
ncbi:hypothetical protein PSACC_03017 [Paramicrosporidium saccamoebae]|uniref:Uncharacterized protein n=1 Tax=Paramicrosporidium saccamoebae TaxID=1246581 RepID=A0A2H9THH1_9FUNG|nr:hypothetical protein PSACC_03017 [Paramicrosporidium saccamoebae]